MTLVLPLALLAALAVLDLSLLLFGKARERLGGARWSLLATPLGAVAAFLAFRRGFGPAADEGVRLGLLVGLPVFAFSAGLCFLVTVFVAGRSAARPLFAAHLAAAILLGVLAMLALERADPLRVSAHRAAEEPRGLEPRSPAPVVERSRC